MMLAFYKKTDKNKLLYYYLHDYQGMLFSKYCITAVWGEGVKPGRKKEFIFENSDELDIKVRDILKIRVKESYKLLYSYPHVNNYKKIFEDFETNKLQEIELKAV